MGRPAKNPDFDAKEILLEQMNKVVDVYLNPPSEAETDRNGHTQMAVLVKQFKLSNLKIRKLLVTAGVYRQVNQKIGKRNGETTIEDIDVCVQKLEKHGYSIPKIMAELHLSRATVYSYLPYEWGMYNAPEISQNAQRHHNYRKRKEAVWKLKECPTEENLWSAVEAFAQYPFLTASGLPFRYTLKKGRSGKLTKELWVDRRESSKSLAWSSIQLAFKNAQTLTGEIIDRPKALGDIRGISYIYPLFWRWGLIQVPEKVAGKMNLNRQKRK